MKRIASKAVLVGAMAAVCGAGLLPGAAAQAQVVAQAGGSPVLAATDWNNHSLDFYTRNDVSGWSAPEQVAGPNTTTSFPAVAQLGKTTGIAVQGENDSLDFYSQTNGGATWGPVQQVGGPGSALYQPALALVGREAVIAVQGPGGVIDVYTEPVGLYYRPGQGPTWTEQQVSGFGSGSPAAPYGAPSIAQVGDAIVIAAQGPNASLYMFWQQIGSSTWNANQVAAAKSTYLLPSVAQVGDATVIATGTDTTMYTYTQPIGASNTPTTQAWTPDLVYSGGEGLADNPSIAQVGNSLVVVNSVNAVSARGEVSTSMETFWQPIGTNKWTVQQVTPQGPFNGGGDPSIAQVGQSVVIGVALNGGNGLFYWESATGTGPWNPENVN